MWKVRESFNPLQTCDEAVTQARFECERNICAVWRRKGLLGYPTPDLSSAQSPSTTTPRDTKSLTHASPHLRALCVLRGGKPMLPSQGTAPEGRRRHRT